MNRLKELRIANGYKSQKELADVLFVNQTAVSQWERGATMPSGQMLLKLSNMYGVSVDYLLGLDGQTEKEPVLTEKDQRDIARDLEQLMDALDTAGDLQFDGDPMSDEARESIKAAMKLGLEAAKVKNKERFTPKKYRKE